MRKYLVSFLKKTLILLLVFALSLGYGLAIIELKLPPYYLIKNVYNNSKDLYKNQQQKIDISKISSDIFISRPVFEASKNLDLVRSNLKNRVILPSKLVSIIEGDSSIKNFNYDSIEHGTPTLKTQVDFFASLYGIKHYSILSKTTKSDVNCLRIYIQGHGGSPFAFKYHNELVAASINSGCDFLSMSMLGIGLNNGDVSFPGYYNGNTIINLNANQAALHGNYAFYFDENYPEKDPLSLFLSPHYHLIKSLADDYENVSIMGISGGGWYTVWLAALLPEIDLSISYAGSLPLVYRTIEENHGHWEDAYSNVYRDIDYWQLYYLTNYVAENVTSRSSYLIYNDNDSCCYGNPSAKHFKSIADQIYDGKVNVIIDSSNDHSMNTKLIQSIW
jgi:hypothetical protein